MSGTFGGNGTATHPTGIAIDSNNLIYVPMDQAYIGNGQYQDGVAFVPSGNVNGQGPYNWDSSWGFDALSSPGRAIYDSANNRVFVLYSGGIAIFRGTSQIGTIPGVTGTNMAIDPYTSTLWVMGSNSLTPIPLSTLTAGSAISLSFSPTQVSFPSSTVILATASGAGHYARIVNNVVDTNFVLYDDNGNGFTGVWQNPTTGDYWVDNGGNVQLLKLGSLPVVLTQPQSVSVPLNSPVSLSAAADLTVFPGSPTYQWQISHDGGTTWSNFNPAYATGNNTTSTTLGLTASCTCDSGEQFRMQITSRAGTVSTNAATVSITQVPAITTNPTGQDATAGRRSP